MRAYIIKRILLFIPSVVIVSIIAFAILVNTPGNPVDRLINNQTDIVSTGNVNMQDQRAKLIHAMGLDLPVFYLSIYPRSEPKVINPAYGDARKKVILQLCHQSGKPMQVLAFHSYLDQLLQHTNNKDTVNALLQLTTINNISQLAANAGIYYDQHQLLPQKAAAIAATPKTYRNWLPSINFNIDNQYHRWFFGDGNWLTGEGAIFTKGVIRGDFGISYQTRQPVSQVIKERIGWSMFFSAGSLIIAILIAIPLALATSGNRSGLKNVADKILITFYSIPSFWTATILLMLFANPDMLQLFPASGVKPATGYPEVASWFSKIGVSLPYLILPMISFSIGAVAYLTGTLKASINNEMQFDYIRTARAKGLSEQNVKFVHAFRNSLLPLITIAAHIFPAVIGGSVILETIFSIPGMGAETFNAIQSQNYPMVIAIFTITSILTMTGILIADILYTIVDPRVRFTKR